MATNRSGDFRDWDIEAEASYSGTDASGFPFYLWRESADNRLFLGRPRYCCITPISGVLHFSFFNPSANVRSTGGARAFWMVTAIVAALITVFSIWDLSTREQLPYAMDERPPPFFMMLAILLYSPFMGLLVAAPWFVIITVSRWVNGRFEGDGKIVHMPLVQLDGFQVITARDAGAMVDGKPAQTGHGLSAVFGGSQLILTGNAWNYRSISDKHRDLTQAFRLPRDEMLRVWVEAQKPAGVAPQSVAPATAAASFSGSGVPDTLD